jgi:hypothetical protein
MQENSIIFVIIRSKIPTHVPDSSWRNQGKLKLKNGLHSNWPIAFKSIKVMKVKEGVRQNSRLKKSHDNHLQH